MAKITKEAQLELADKIREFVISKWGKLSKGAKILGVSPSALSMILKGTREPTRKLLLSLINSGFDKDHFDKYYMTRNDENLNHLSNKELLEFANQQRFLIYQYQDMIKFLSLRIDQLTKK